GRVHLSVKKLNHSAELCRDFVGDEDEPDSSGAEIGLGSFPELVGVYILTKHRTNVVIGFHTVGRAPRFVRQSQLIWWPINHGVCSIVEHLPNDLTADARVRAALHLNQRG